ncbi:Panthothenate kinase (CoaA) [Fructobacillus tropaeoli]|uniref:type I pantothenate kinase n=1 Tax=Fructobacillus tropaeoli TaxID=709323 RepID=UPI002DA5D029|nr:Panthothenate kinase (CoaA) [Fructobacillus tropaeoli]
MTNLVEKIYEAHHGSFLTVGMTGSVAVGKSTLAAELAQGLQKKGLVATVISTDDFLKTNQVLKDEGIFDQKGFPQSYYLQDLVQLIGNFKAGMKNQVINRYSQTWADIVPGEKQEISRPDILIIEGVVALQLPAENLDQTVFVEADMNDIKDWYLERNFLATVKASNQPQSWRYQYKDMAIKDFYDLALSVWEKTNQVNYDRYIQKTRADADLILQLDRYHHPVSLTMGSRSQN